MAIFSVDTLHVECNNDEAVRTESGKQSGHGENTALQRKVQYRVHVGRERRD